MHKDILLEIGLEELPARFVDSAQKQLETKTAEWLEGKRISYDSIVSFSTPRRLAVLVKNAAEAQVSLEEEMKGPAEKIAKDDEGNWSKAAIGFTKGQGKTVDDIYTKEIKGTSYIFVKKYIEGKQTQDLLPGFKEIITQVQFGKNMRWGSNSMRYGRPIRWLAALYGNEIIPFELAGVSAGNTTEGHRFLGEIVTLEEPSDYEKKLLDQFVIANPKKREQMIVEGIRELEEKENFHIPEDEELLDEVRNLVEYPTVFAGSFSKDYLDLPAEVLITSMKEHQRYFPVKSAIGELLPYFVGVRNGDDRELATVIRGNEKVLHARLSDARFFYEEDLKLSPDHFLDKLERVVFQEKLGTYGDKVKRVVHITEQLSELLELNGETKEAAKRAAQIGKFDLTTNMVNEFTGLQGTIGEKYALFFGEKPAAAKAISEQYLPKQAGGELPETTAGTVVSIADKLDTIVGCIAVGLVPTGSQDPYGLRRQATGILRMLKENNWDVSLEQLLIITQNLYQTLDIEWTEGADLTKELDAFFRLRASYLLREAAIGQDVIQAVLANGIGIFAHTFEKAQVLSEKRNDESFKYIQEALVRVLNLAEKADDSEVEPALLATDSERELYAAYQKTLAEYNQKADKHAEEKLLILGQLAEPIHAFFDHTMVMVEEDEIRNNRLGLLQKIANLVKNYADLAVIEWKQHF
ncbi:glycine--tRNA ligase subunit beta [Lentibacillus sediminis]|uniref:glycine--tRNA ligase subunit beta n=1 Tax=Lentibacillus sediminis TaxID=1940529 RepID=UPI000C1BD04F|nr:glycine--tRNA ligase subunit beta [Lentibacillus sediminis]